MSGELTDGPPLASPPDRADFIAVNDTTLRTWEWGAVEAPPVLLVHGAFDHGRMFDSVGPFLARLGYRAIAIDQRGHGDSGRLNSGNNFAINFLDLCCLTRMFDKPIGLLAHSMGASLCFSTCGAMPELIRWCVSLDSLGPPSIAFESPPITEVATMAFDYGIKTFGRGARVFPDRDAMAAQRGAINTRLPKPWLDHLVEHGSTEVEGGWTWKWDPAFNVGIPNGFREENIHAELARVTCPVLVLTGAEDDMWSEMGDDEIAFRIGLMADARQRSIDGGGHYLHLEQPDAVFAEIAAFLAEVD
ncbi:MAG: alpha/beta hydrolase [Acidimicrobiales bacterium]|nr:alpha/beta hydrolase [Acidimicrobiales bacterium]